MSEVKASRKGTGKVLMEALTSEQAAALLDVVLGTVDVKTRDEILGKLDQDTTGTIRRILSGESGPPGSARSDSKVKSDWGDLWAEWYEIASEAGDEEGRYMEQDHHWEPPCFGGDELASDLDTVAQKMRPIMAKVSDERDVFAQGAIEVDKQVGELPDWIGAAEMGYCFGPLATRCLLEWEYRHAQEASEDVGTFFSHIAGVCDRLEAIVLDSKEIEQFCLRLPKRERQAIYGHLKAAEDAGGSGGTDSRRMWSELFHALSEEFDQAS